MAGEITRIALPGAAGRMGKMIRDLVAEKAEFEIAALTEHSDHPLVGSTTNGVFLSADADVLGLGKGGVIVDFTRPEATLTHIEIARKTGTAMVIGTTGFTNEQEKALSQQPDGRLDTAAAAEAYGRYMLGAATDHLLETSRRDRERIFNLGYYTWVEQQGVDVSAFEVRREQSFWDGLMNKVPQWDAMIDDFNSDL